MITKQEIQKLKHFIDEAERLIVKHIASPRIRRTHIKHIASYRKSLAKLSEPASGLAVKFLDQLIELAEVLNEQGVNAAEPYAKQALNTLDEIDALLRQVQDDGI